MSLSHEIITLSGSTPTLIDNSDVEYYYLDVTIQNIHETNDVYIGGLDLTSSSFGYLLVSGGSVSFSRLGKKDDLYVLGSDDNTPIAVLKSYTLKR